jgi:8-oxo-dGTP pyrophosphatase MutT (NUDIX family)
MKQRKQVAALPVRVSSDGTLEALLVTTRETHRWVIPKGWVPKGVRPHKAAEREALEEAGVEGVIDSEPLGSFTYLKRLKIRSVPVEVTVYVLKVTRQRRSWRETRDRQRRWVPLQVAPDVVEEPDLAELLKMLIDLEWMSTLQSSKKK